MIQLFLKRIVRKILNINIYINKVNLPAKIIFDCKNSDDNFIMKNKTKKFELNELITFKNELIYFFNIIPNKSEIYISLEINGKKLNFDEKEMIKLNNITKKKENEEIILKTKDGLELIINIKIMDKFNKTDIFNVFNEKIRESINILNKKTKYIHTGVSIQERVKLFSGKEKENLVKNKTKNKPGKLKVPEMFQKSNKISSNNIQNVTKKVSNDKKDNPKTNNLEFTTNNKKIENNNDNKKISNDKKITDETKEEKKIDEDKNKTSGDSINANKEKKEEKIENNNKEDFKIEDSYDFKYKLNIKENINNKMDDNNNNDLEDLYEERECVSDEEGEKVNEECENDNEEKKVQVLEEKNENLKENKDKEENKEIIKEKIMNENKNDMVEDIQNLNINQEKENEQKKDNIEKNNKINITKEKENLQTIKNIKMGATISYHQKIKGSPSFKSSLGDIFLESQNYATYLKSLQQKGIKESKRETFCEGFFISSFPFKNPSVVEKSQSFPAPCGHAECSKLPAMKPEIIMRYPLKDTKNLEMNNLAASICFPTGIKVCYSEDKPSNIKDYVTPITNQKGERYYMITFHFYKKYMRDEFDKKYDIHPLKHHLMRFGDAYLSLSEDELTKEKIKEIQDSLEFCQELGFRDFLYVPYCLCIISKYPYVNELKICLNSIYKLLIKDKTLINTEEEKYEINNLLMHLIHSVPIPDSNSLVKFFVPYYDKKIEIKCPKIEDINIMNVNTISLLKVFSIDNIVTIFKLILSEKKILFIDQHYERLAIITDSFITLLYPFQWIHTYIPIMSEQMIKYVETFLPYINGIHDSLLPLVTNIFKENDEQKEEVFLIYINEDKIKLSSSLCGKNVNKKKYIQDHIPGFPSELEKKLKNKLKKMKSDISSAQKSESLINSAELEMRDIFIDFFIDLLHGYEKYIFLLDEQEVVFNKALFLDTIPNCDKKFYDDLIDTQLFQNFAQNIIKEDFDYYFNKLNFKEKERASKKGKNMKEKGKEIKDNDDSISKIKNMFLDSYVVAPNYLNIKDTEVRNIEQSLKKKYPQGKNESVIKDRIVLDLIEIDKTKFINDNCLIYMTPEQIKAEQGKLKNDNLELRRSAIPKYTGSFSVLKAKMNVKLAMRSTLAENDANEKKKALMREYIRDLIVKIFKSEVDDIDSNMKSNFMNIIEMTFGREYFISLISHNEKLVLLKYEAFKLLGNLFYNTLIGTLKIDENDKVIEEIVLLIKSSKYFGMEENGITITIFDDYKKKIENTPKIVQYNYWKKTFDLDLKNMKNKENEDENKLKQKIIYNLVKEMIDLQIIKSVVKSVIEKLTNDNFGKDSEISKEIIKALIKQISNARYISKIKEEQSN